MSSRISCNHVGPGVLFVFGTSRTPLHPTIVRRTHAGADGTCRFTNTVEPVITHTPRWTVQGMGYHRLWVMAVLNIPAHQVGGRPELWVTTGYGLSQVWVLP